MNRGKPRQCADCGTSIGPASTRCKKCAAQARWEDEGYRRKIAATLKAKWQDPEFRRKQIEAMTRQEKAPANHCVDCEAEISRYATRCRKCAAKAVWADKEFRHKEMERRRSQWTDPEFRRKHVERIRKWSKELWQDPEHRRKQTEQFRERAKALWQDPDYRCKQAEARAKLREKRRKAKSD